MSKPQPNGRVVRESSGAIEMCLAIAKRKIASAHLAMGESLGSTDPLKYHRQMKIAQRLMIEAQQEVDNAQILARNIQVITIQAAKRESYNKVDGG